MMDLKLEFHSQQGAMYGDVSSNHGSFSSASGPVGSSYDAFTPVSMSGRSTPVGSQRMGSVDYSSNASFAEMPLEMTPPSSATMPFFNMNMPPTTAAGMTANYLSSSAFPQPPATPERNASFSSHVSVGTPGSPSGIMAHSYPASVGSMSSMTSMATLSSGASPHHDSVLCGPVTPGGYPFPESMPSKANGLAGQYPLPTPYHRGSYPTPQSAHLAHDGSDYSPSEFCWNNRPESPAINYFGERPSLPPPPPSATLKSSVVKNEGADAYLSPTSESPYGASSSHRALHYMGAQSSARALQGAVDANENHGYGPHIATNPASTGTIVTRNGIQVSRVASGAYKCIVAGCPSRPFKRSEHLKRHVTTYVFFGRNRFHHLFCPLTNNHSLVTTRTRTRSPASFVVATSTARTTGGRT